MPTKNARKETGLKQANVCAITMEEDVNGIDTLTADTDKSLALRNVFATLLAVGGKTQRMNA